MKIISTIAVLVAAVGIVLATVAPPDVEAVEEEKEVPQEETGERQLRRYEGDSWKYNSNCWFMCTDHKRAKKKCATTGWSWSNEFYWSSCYGRGYGGYSDDDDDTSYRPDSDDDDDTSYRPDSDDDDDSSSHSCRIWDSDDDNSCQSSDSSGGCRDCCRDWCDRKNSGSCYRKCKNHCYDDADCSDISSDSDDDDDTSGGKSDCRKAKDKCKDCCERSGKNKHVSDCKSKIKKAKDECNIDWDWKKVGEKKCNCRD